MCEVVEKQDPPPLAPALPLLGAKEWLKKGVKSESTEGSRKYVIDNFWQIGGTDSHIGDRSIDRSCEVLGGGGKARERE